jgi:sRNA-binding protein
MRCWVSAWTRWCGNVTAEALHTVVARGAGERRQARVTRRTVEDERGKRKEKGEEDEEEEKQAQAEAKRSIRYKTTTGGETAGRVLSSHVHLYA